MKYNTNKEVVKLQGGKSIPDKRTQKLFDNVTSKILQNDSAKNKNISSTTGIRYEQPLKDIHPGLYLALMYAQPGNIVTKAFAPSMAKGFVEGVKSGDTQQALLSMLVPGGNATKSLAKSNELARILNKEVKNIKISDSPITQNILAGKLGWAPRQNKVIWHFLDSSYDGRYTVTPEQGFTRRNQGGVERVEYMKKNPVEKLNATSAGETSIQEQIDLASRDFAKKYKDEFLPNFTKAIQYDALTDGTLGYTEGTILGPYVKHFGIAPGQIKFAHSHGDASPLARLVEAHEAHHATGNMNDPFVLRHLIEKGLIDESKLTSYFKDADRGEVTAHLSELPDWLGFTGRINGKYIGHPFGKTNITSTDIYNFNKWNHNNGFKNTIWDAINKDKMSEFVKFMNEHPFVITLPVVGLGGAAISKHK